MSAVTNTPKPSMSGEESGGSWLVVVAAFFVQFIICGISYSLGIFHIVFQDVYAHNHFDTSWIGSIQLYTTALTSILFRCFMSRFGCRFCVMAGGVLSAVGLGLGIMVTDLYQLYLTFGVLTGIGFGLACTPSIMIVEQHFHETRFEALSIVAGGIGAGIITFPVVIRHLLDYFSWRGTLLILSGVAFHMVIFGAVMKPAPKKKAVHLMPLLSCLPLRHPIFHGMCIANLFWSFGSTVIYMYLPAYAIEKGTDFYTSTFLISCIGMASFTARMIFAFMGHNSTLDDVTALLCSVCLGVVLTGVSPLLFKDFAGQIGYTLLFGFYSGYWTIFLSQVSRELIGPEYIAMGNGYLSFMVAVGSLLGGPAAGLLIQEESEFQYAFYLAGACLLWSSIIMLLFKLKRCGQLPATEKSLQSDQKIPLVDRKSEKQFKVKTIEGENIFVEAITATV
ncbi:hypothetical protein CHS0354_020560 [Potamilus streckersoni]|uniref:Major facilitator superfamily (MFS) profile domain-containing protein n=1 Tax=Potamilus streckersoni TaxID=2493646 RepID=A0AAE0SNB9_9BIVA|nr:hypothetical protein CHS0354_020560 [Potamilus streckersoni]